ncbi:unnamed protein product [Darwinula stevensoni]|uniref:Kinetochore protein Nuf2 N-terminal domain-containing protein n=1 Tax=Darwinula stevensoni TaxID=69355 RepID=A0A7R8WXT9_9CRUS|nr:unnamed protein product [Darwinula stevensoni]CAG0878694.1 unnamed protein product [Darwinula stevensoni]
MPGQVLTSMEYPEMFYETMPDVILFSVMKPIMEACLVSDFRLEDVIRPRKQYFRRILSGLLNFLGYFLEMQKRFLEREQKVLLEVEKAKEQQRDLSKLKEEMNELTVACSQFDYTLEGLQGEQTKKMERMETLERRKEDMKSRAAELREELESLTNELLSASETVNQVEKEGKDLESRIIRSPNELMKSVLAAENEVLEKEREYAYGLEKSTNLKKDYKNCESLVSLKDRVMRMMQEIHLQQTSLRQVQDDMEELEEKTGRFRIDLSKKMELKDVKKQEVKLLAEQIDSSKRQHMKTQEGKKQDWVQTSKLVEENMKEWKILKEELNALEQQLQDCLSEIQNAKELQLKIHDNFEAKKSSLEKKWEAFMSTLMQQLDDLKDQMQYAVRGPAQ